MDLRSRFVFLGGPRSDLADDQPVRRINGNVLFSPRNASLPTSMPSQPVHFRCRINNRTLAGGAPGGGFSLTIHFSPSLALVATAAFDEPTLRGSARRELSSSRRNAWHRHFRLFYRSPRIPTTYEPPPPNDAPWRSGSLRRRHGRRNCLCMSSKVSVRHRRAP